mmetsp:Transcript_13899/g.40299  ORF Transcript_13899/g.40299 Transcript_13899/m.40299 type:complete len:256 (-) Transcript_13899:521-1288(-)
MHQAHLVTAACKFPSRGRAHVCRFPPSSLLAYVPSQRCAHSIRVLRAFHQSAARVPSEHGCTHAPCALHARSVRAPCALHNGVSGRGNTSSVTTRHALYQSEHVVRAPSERGAESLRARRRGAANSVPRAWRAPRRPCGAAPAPPLPPLPPRSPCRRAGAGLPGSHTAQSCTARSQRRGGRKACSTRCAACAARLHSQGCRGRPRRLAGAAAVPCCAAAPVAAHFRRACVARLHVTRARRVWTHRGRASRGQSTR